MVAVLPPCLWARWFSRPPAPVRDPEAVRHDLRRRVRAIELLARRRLQAPMLGDYRSAFRGVGLEFQELRAYVPGDDVRFLDWKVTARRRSPYVRRYLEERERTILLVVDMSASLTFGVSGRSVRDAAIETAGLLGFAAARSSDRVGVVAFAERVCYTLPPRKGERHVLRALHDLFTLAPAGSGTGLAAALEYTAGLARRRSAVFVLSDFHAAGWEPALRRLASRHEVAALCIRDPREALLPSRGLLRVEDAERGATRLIDADAAQAATARAARAERERTRHALRAAGPDAVFLDTDADAVPALAALFRARAARR